MSWHGNTTNTIPNLVQSDVNRSEGRVADNRALHTHRNDSLKSFGVTIKQIDETVLTHLQNMQLSVVDAGNTINVPVSYASPEKWYSIRNLGFMRDNNGRIILPAIIFYRTSSEADKTMMTFNKYLRYSVINQYSQKNQYTRFATLARGNVPVNEVYNVVMPDHMNFNYKFIIWTEYIEQMNALIERINFETNDYWGTEKGFRFRTFIDAYTHTTEVENDKDRLIRTEFDLVLRGYLLPELFAPGLDGFKPTTEKVFTKKKIIMGIEVVASDWQPAVDKMTKDHWRSQQFPNIVLGTEPPSLRPVFVDGLQRTVYYPPITIGETTIKWHTAPVDLTDPGAEGWKAYDSNYYYYYTGGMWHRVPINLFDDISPALVSGEGEDGYDADYYYIYVLGNWKRTPIITFQTFY